MLLDEVMEPTAEELEATERWMTDVLVMDDVIATLESDVFGE